MRRCSLRSSILLAVRAICEVAVKRYVEDKASVKRRYEVLYSPARNQRAEHLPPGLAAAP